MSTVSTKFDKLPMRLRRLYGADSDRAVELVQQVVDEYLEKQRCSDSSVSSSRASSQPAWDQKDVVLITYGDQISDDGSDRTPLAALLAFLKEHQLTELLNTVHFLPFFPYSSDDGFSVINYRQVDPALGDWKDVESVGDECCLMFDFVVNHVSQQHDWFQQYLCGNPEYENYFIQVDPEADHSGVTRPRSLPLFHEFQPQAADDESKWVWTTFSRDQVDINYGHPEVLAEAVSVLLDYVARGARIIRLDAIAYLWKSPGTNCIHLPETHMVVKVFREILDSVAPHVILLTETNVPHEENVSYFGDGDEAHMVYQFSLPPLLIDAFLHEDVGPLKRWLSELQAPVDGTTFFNFTASHDGIGVRALEGRVENERLASLVEKIRARGGLVNMKRNADGTDSPYELNITYLDALGDETPDSDVKIRRFLASQAIMLSLQGIPAVYFHSLVGTPNDLAGMKASGINRRINRRKYQKAELDRLVVESDLQSSVFAGMQQLIRVRTAQPAFHPGAEQTYIESGSDSLLTFERACPEQSILVLANVSGQTVQWVVPTEYGDSTDLLSGDRMATTIELGPAEVMWLERKS